MVNHWSDTEIIKRMTQKLNQCVEPDKPVLKEPIRKVSFEEFKPTTPVSPTTRRTSAPKDFDLRTPSTKAEQANMNGKGRSAASVTKDPSAPKSRARFACKILPREWTDTPIITSIPKILSSLRDGLPVPGNLLFSADPNVITEVQAIWNAYELKDDFTVAILAPPTPSVRRCLFGGLMRKRNLSLLGISAPRDQGTSYTNPQTPCSGSLPQTCGWR